MSGRITVCQTSLGWIKYVRWEDGKRTHIVGPFANFAAALRANLNGSLCLAAR